MQHLISVRRRDLRVAGPCVFPLLTGGNMKKSRVDIVRAWKDEEYRESLSPEEKALVPSNPAGVVELTDEDLAFVLGGIVEVQECGTKTGTGTGTTSGNPGCTGCSCSCCC
jgi:mersacidin/lichenicidin family type 2 lantibiotic